jgi:hypothetical protein
MLLVQRLGGRKMGAFSSFYRPSWAKEMVSWMGRLSAQIYFYTGEFRVVCLIILGQNSAQTDSVNYTI